MVRQCIANLTRSLGRYNVVSHVDSDFLQMLLWERFGTLAPTPIEYFTMVPNRAGVINLMRATSIYRAHKLRWSGVKLSADKSFAVAIYKEENFNFGLYVFIPTDIHRVKILEEVSLEVALVPRSTVPLKFQFFLGIVTPMLVSFMLESEKGVTVSNPQ